MTLAAPALPMTNLAPADVMARVIGKPQQTANREVAVRAASEDEDYDIEFSFSSEQPVDRWFGREIVSNAPGAVNLDRLNDGGMLLFNHNRDQWLGKIVKAWIDEKTEKGMVRAVFSEREFAQEVKKDVLKEIMTLVSYAYEVNEMQLTKQGDADTPDEWTVTKSTPLEVSFVTVPADPTVGYGRALEVNQYPPARASVTLKPTETRSKPMAASSVQDPVELQISDAERQQLQDQARESETGRIRSIISVCRQHGCEDLADGFIDGNASMAEVNAKLLAHLAQQQKNTARQPAPGQEPEPVGLPDPIGLTDKQARQWSFFRALRAYLNPQSAQLQEEAAFERDVTRAMGKERGMAYSGVGIPLERLKLPMSRTSMEWAAQRYGPQVLQQRGLSVGSAASAGLLVDTDFRPELIDILRNQLAVVGAGATLLTGLEGPLEFPRKITTTTAEVVAEGGFAADSEFSIERVAWSPKTISGNTTITRRMLNQSSLDVENLALMDLMDTVTIKLDHEALYGPGTANNITGLKLISGVNTVDFAAAAPTYDEIVAMKTAVFADNANIGTMSYLVNATGSGALETARIDPGSGIMVLTNGRAAGFPVRSSNQVEAGDYWFGNWASLYGGLFSGFDVIRAMDDDQIKAGGITVAVLVDADFNARHPEAFCRGNNTIP